MVDVKRLGAAAALFATPVSPLHAQGEGTPTVSCNAPGASLQNKIANASVGSSVFVTGSCDDGPIFIAKDISLIGFDGGATLSAPAGGFAALNIFGGLM